MSRSIHEIEADIRTARLHLLQHLHDIAAHLEALRNATAPTVRCSMAAAFESQRQAHETLSRYRAELESHPDFKLDLFREMFTS